MDQASEVMAEAVEATEEEKITELLPGLLDKIGGGIIGVLI